jgi:hypothetical protein
MSFLLVLREYTAVVNSICLFRVCSLLIKQCVWESRWHTSFTLHCEYSQEVV